MKEGPKAKPPGGSKKRPRNDRVFHGPDHPNPLAEQGVDKQATSAKGRGKAKAITGGSPKGPPASLAERRVGQLMKELRDAGKLAKGAKGNPRGRGGKIVRVAGGPTQTLAEQGVDKHLADRARANALRSGVTTRVASGPASLAEQGERCARKTHPRASRDAWRRLKTATMPPGLTDAQLDALMAAAKPLRPEARDEFVRAVLTRLPPEPGDGEVFRAICELQTKVFS